MQRIAESDPVGFIKSGNLEGEWKYVKIPAVIDDEYLLTLPKKYRSLIEKSEKDERGRFSYWPYKEPLHNLLAMERGDGADQTGAKISRHVFTSQYQQNPVAIGGNLIKGEWFKHYSVLPKIKYRKIFADTAMKTKEQNDFSVFEEWGVGEDGHIYLLDMLKGKFEAPELQRRAATFWNKCKGRTLAEFGQLREMCVEDKGLIQTLKMPPFNIPIKPIERIIDKVTRVLDVLPYIECGQVHLPSEAAFTNDFIAECESFTTDDSHDHDDSIDAMCDAIVGLLAAGNKIKQWEVLK
jgi:predicted phage terminase large subunit-like protein